MAENGILDYQGMNQAIYRGATSNIVVDTQSMSIEIGAGNTSHTSNLHFECNHDANVASIKLNSNVTTEFSRSKKLIKYPRVAMTQNDESGTSGYVTNASSWENQASNETNGPWNNFNGILNDSAWQTSPRKFNNTSGDWDGTTTAPYAISLVGGTTIYGEWVELKIPNKIQLHTCRIAPMTHSPLPNLGRHRSPRNGYILGRVGATGNWTVLKSWSDVIHDWEDLVLRDFDIENPSEYYDYFRVVWTAINGNTNYSVNNGAGYASSGEIEFLGVPEYDSDAHGTEVVIKSVPNVPNTDWLEVYHDAKDLENGPVSTTAGDISGLGGTANNGTAYGDPQISNGAFVLDGTGDYISTPVNADLSNHTASMWIVFDNPSTWEAVYYLGPSSGLTGENNIAVYVHSNPYYFRIESSGRSFDVDYDFVPGKWVHMTVLFRGASGLQDLEVYIDNVRLLHNGTSTNPTDSYSITGSNNLIIGSANGGGYPLEGKIANFRLFNRALTTDEIYQLYAYQKEYFGHSTNSLTLKAGRLGIGTSEPLAALDVYGELYGPRTKPCFSIHTDAYWTANYNSWGSDSSSHWVCVYRTPIPFVPRSWLEHDSHDAISFTDVTRGSNTGTIVKFTAPRSGFYHFSFNIGFKSSSAGDYVGFMLNKNDTSVSSGSVTTNDYFLGSVHTPSNTAHAITINSSVNFYLNKGEFVVPYSRSVNKSYVADGGGFSFSGFYIG